MASSNKHWPSMFKSKPGNNHHTHQWQHLDHNPNSLLSSGCHRHPYTSGLECEERSPEPKPRWNPKPEQIRILEAIFNSGIVNPPRDEIRKIRAQLQEYGQVGDANVFYWFQNRKSRSKHKLRHLKEPGNTTSSATSSALPLPPSTTSSSSSSEKSSMKGFPMEMTNSPTASVNNNPTYFQAPAVATEFLPEPYQFPVGGFSFPEISGGVHAPVDGNLLLGELLIMNNNNDQNNYIEPMKKVGHDHEKIYNTTVDTVSVPSDTCASVTSTAVPSTISHFLGVGDSHPVGPAKTTVFINDVAFEVSAGPFNVREAFGEDAMLIGSNGQPVFTNEWGVTIQSLQHGGFYYLVRALAPVTMSEAQLI